MAIISALNKLLLLLVCLCLSHVVKSQSQESEMQNLRERKRRMVGGYKSIDPQSEYALAASTFAFVELKTQNMYSFQPLLLSDSEDLDIKVLEASQQVVAGLNIKFKAGLYLSGNCVGGFSATVYNHFGELSVSNWGPELDCTAVDGFTDAE